MRRQSTLSETLARVAAPNFAFIIFAFFSSTSLRPEWVLARQTKSRESEQLLVKVFPIIFFYRTRLRLRLMHDARKPFRSRKSERNFR